MRSTHESKVYTRTSRRLSCDNVVDMEKCKDSKINTYSLTFKERSLNVFFYLSAHHQRRDVFFIADAKKSNVAYQADEKKENEGFAMLKCWLAIASFEADCQSVAVRSSLLLLVWLLLYGPKYRGPSEHKIIKS